MDFVFAPFAFLLRFLAETLNNYGLALILFSATIAIFRLPFDFKGRRSNLKQAILQPKVKEIQEKHAGNQQKIHMETQKLWQQEGVKPLGGCVWMLLPAAIMLIMITIVREPLRRLMDFAEPQLIALREAMTNAGIELAGDGVAGFAQVEMAGFLRDSAGNLPTWVPNEIIQTTNIFPINMEFLGFLNLGETPRWQFWTFFEMDNSAMWWGLFFLPLFSVVMMYISQRIMMATNFMQQTAGAQQQQMMKMMTTVFPLISLFIGYSFPAAMSVYFISSSFFFTVNSIFINRRVKKIYEQMKAEMEERDRQREAELEAKRQETARLRALNATRENKATSKKKKQAQEREKERQRLAAQRAGQSPEDDDDVDEDDKEEATRVGHRKFARGRAYDPERFLYPEDELSEDEDEELREDAEEPGDESAEETEAWDVDEEDEIESGENGERDDEAWESEDDSWDDDDDDWDDK